MVVQHCAPFGVHSVPQRHHWNDQSWVHLSRRGGLFHAAKRHQIAPLEIVIFIEPHLTNLELAFLPVTQRCAVPLISDATDRSLRMGHEEGVSE